MATILEFLQAKTNNVPEPYGIFHLIFCALVIGSSIFLALYSKKLSDKKVRTILLIMWASILVLEGYKQIIWNFKVDGGVVVREEYNWYDFPFQFCSSVLYVLPLVALLKDSKFRDALIVFSSLFIFFAGLIVYILPTDIYTEYIGINFQTSIHHGVQIVAGVLIASFYRDKFTLKNYLRAFLVFTVFVAVAMVINEVVYSLLDVSVNFFFISRHIPCHLPVLSTVYASVPYIVFLIVYFFGFALVAFIIFMIEVLITKRIKYIK